MVPAEINRTDPSVLLSTLADIIAGVPHGQSVGLLVLHIENFDRLVSAFGHRMGNGVLGAFATRLKETIRTRDTILRFSDSKFAIIVNGVHNEGHLVLAANKISQIFERPIPIGTNNITATLRCGISMSPEHATNPEDLLQHAETALLSAVGNDTTYELYTQAQSDEILDALGLEIELDMAIKRGEFELYYQPKMGAADLTPCGAEALIRWQNPKRGPISPEIFIPMADRTGRIEPVTSFVLNTALRQAADWPRLWGDLSVSINVTPKVVERIDLAGMVGSALGMWDSAPERLIVEITEGAIMANPQASFRVLSQLRNLGAHVSIDDFGTGYSSLAYFKNIPADELKIDKSFVISMLEDAGDRQIVEAILELARSFGLAVTAEGVEDQRTATELRSMNCDRLQGYYYSRPLPQQEFVSWLKSYRPEAAPQNRRAGV